MLLAKSWNIELRHFQRRCFLLKIQSAIFQTPKLRRYLDPTNTLSIAFCATIQLKADILSKGHMICASQFSIHYGYSPFMYAIPGIVYL